MPETLRTFIAVELTGEIRTVLEDIQNRLKTFHADVKWVEPQNIHLTLKFLGDVKSKDIPLLTETLTAALKGTTPIPTELAELGAFPDLRRPRVLWAGLKDEDGRIAQLAAAIEEVLGKIGYKKEPRDFKAHVTLGRMRSLKNIAPLVKELQEYRFPRTFPQVIAGITLFKSTLTSSGPLYEILKKFDFSS
jgi:2'-5' RNA ligase